MLEEQKVQLVNTIRKLFFLRQVCLRIVCDHQVTNKISKTDNLLYMYPQPTKEREVSIAQTDPEISQWPEYSSVGGLERLVSMSHHRPCRRLPLWLLKS